MVKHDLKKLALLGLAGGLIIANSVEASGDQQILSQMNSAASEHTVARLIASPSTGDNWNSSNQPQTRQNSGAGPRTSSGLRNDSGARGPGGVRQQTTRNNNDRNSFQSAQNRPNNQPQFSAANEISTPNQGTHSAGSNTNNSKRGQLALGDAYDTLTDDTAEKTGPNSTDQGSSAGEYVYKGGGACGSLAIDDEHTNQNERASHQDYDQPRKMRQKHGCGASSCSSHTRNDSGAQATRQQPPARSQHQDKQNQFGGQKAGFSDQTQPQAKQRPGASGDQGVSTQRNNNVRQQQNGSQSW